MKQLLIVSQLANYRIFALYTTGSGPMCYIWPFYIPQALDLSFKYDNYGKSGNTGLCNSSHLH